VKSKDGENKPKKFKGSVMNESEKDAILRVYPKSRELSGGLFDENVENWIKKGSYIAISWSGGKDSCLLLKRALDERFNVKFLFNLVDKKEGISISPPFNSELMILQAKSLCIPLIQVDISENPRNEFRKFLVKIKRRGIEGIGVSYIDPKGQREFVREMAEKAGLSVFEPFCGKDREELIEEVINGGIRAAIISIDSSRVDQRILGRVIDRKMVEFLKKSGGIDLCGENGEFQTLVLDCPIFKNKISVEDYELITDGSFYHLYIKRAKLIEKNI
jgi:uncharacterized protein (TIGR00290 family)